MHLLLLVTLVMNLHMASLRVNCHRDQGVQPVRCPNLENHKQEVPPQARTQVALYPTVTRINDIDSSHSTTTSNGTVGQPAAMELQGRGSAPRQKLTLSDINDFRLEYNKYKILSHLSITKRVEEMAPKLNDELRRSLTSKSYKGHREADERARSQPRLKRSITCGQLKDDKNACCLETFYVNFTYIGWDKWILYPPGYNANYCRGQCDLSHARYYHSTLLSKYSNVMSLCCSPKQMAPLRLLYIDEDNKVHQKSIPNMIVEGCDCA